MNVLISGAGIAGLTLALALLRQGHRPLLLEKTPALRGGGYMIDFYGPGYDVAEAMGLLPALERIHYPIERLAFLDARGKEKFALQYRELRRLFDNRHFNFLRGDLEQLLYDKIKGEAEVRFGTAIGSFDQEGGQVRVRFSDGTTGSFDLLVGADGVHSQVRSLAFGEEERFFRFLGYYTAAFMLEDSGFPSIHRDAFQTLTVPGRQVAVYPVRGGRLATFFLYRSREVIAGYSPEAVHSRLDRVFGDLDWIVSSLLKYGRRSDDLYFDSVAQIEMPRWSEGRVVLIGDACACLSLLAGQGASMAMFGAKVLAEELERARTGVESALVSYEERVRPAVAERQAAGRSMADWFVPNSRLRLAVRDLITRFSTWPPVSPLVKRSFLLGAKS